MFGNFFYGKLSLRESFWKFCILGITVLGFLSRLFMTQLKQVMNYDTNFIRVAIKSLSLIQMNTTAMALFSFYLATLLALMAYSIMCIGAMWNTYKEYDKSKTLALICLIIVCCLSYTMIRYALY
ncbi:MAG: hypothetical protein IJ864_05190 [Alphaproteobacteria bacterium]|nr:hypothetical protein [Alphaproteobacteria bacterium]